MPRPAIASGSGRYDDADIGNLIGSIRSNWPDGRVPIVETTTVSKALYLTRLSLSDDHKLPCVECTNLTSSGLRDETGRLVGGLPIAGGAGRTQTRRVCRGKVSLHWTLHARRNERQSHAQVFAKLFNSTALPEGSWTIRTHCSQALSRKRLYGG